MIKIKRLKYALEWAKNYDHVPSAEFAMEIIDAMEYDGVLTVFLVEDILKEFEGYSPSNIIDFIVEEIDAL